MNSINILVEEIKSINSTKKELRKFAYSVGVVLFILGLILFFMDFSSGIWLGGIGISLVLIGIIFPTILLPLQKIWMGIAVILGFIMTRLILSILFIFIITPIKFIAFISGKRFLDEKIDKKSDSYWNYRDKVDYEKLFTERQF